MTRLLCALFAAAVLSAWALPASAQEVKLIEQGKAVYDLQKCVLCHSVGGRGNAKGPLDQAGARLSPDDIRRWIVAPQQMTSPTGRKPAMRAYPNLPAADLEALVAYLGSLKGSG